MVEYIGYAILGMVLIIYLALIFTGNVPGVPEGIIGFLVILGMGLLFIKVLKERLSNKEDDYYNRTVDK